MESVDATSRRSNGERRESGVVVNPCKACAPLGATLALKGVARSMCLLHGSQGCATYIRRYLIGHFREPVDVASSSFDESTAVFGGRRNLLAGVENVIRKYDPEVIGIATTCLAETIGEDIGLYKNELPGRETVEYVWAETAAYKGSHVDGFMRMTESLAKLAVGEEHVDDSLAASPSPPLRLNLFPWMVSPADLRFLKRILIAAGIEATLLPDYSTTLDGGLWSDYEPIPPGGTPLAAIRAMGRADHSIVFGELAAERCNPAKTIYDRCAVPYSVLPLPIGLANSDRFLERLAQLGARATREGNGRREVILPQDLRDARARLMDAYADAHKYFAGMTAAVYGEGDFVVAMAGFLSEVGIHPSICLTSDPGSRLLTWSVREAMRRSAGAGTEPTIAADADFSRLDALLEEHRPDVLVGNSKGYKSARAHGIPLVRAGFPIQDRFGGQRLLHLGYEGALRMTDELANVVIAGRQDASPVGYMSM
ncbi:MAG: nitrogenase component 1 [Spirochaetota bacterium]